MRVVQFIDTSVFVEYLDVPGLNSQHKTVSDEMERRIAANIAFVLPVTTIIETGNHIAQCGGDRRGAAERFVRALELAKASKPPWIVRDVAWNQDFPERFVQGASTGSDLLTHLSNRTLGSGDAAILVEREQFKKSIAADEEIWTLDRETQLILLGCLDCTPQAALTAKQMLKLERPAGRPQVPRTLGAHLAVRPTVNAGH